MTKELNDKVIGDDANDKVIGDDVKDHYESQVRSANYLLVAHAAGLVGV